MTKSSLGTILLSCAPIFLASCGSKEEPSEQTERKKPQLTTSHVASASKTTVHSTGSAETRDAALVDACRLAVAQVHGGLISGGLVKTMVENEKDHKTQETHDLTLLTFQGLLLGYKVIEEYPPASAGELWKTSIVADVLTAMPDRFAGKTAVVLPTPQSLSYRNGNSETLREWNQEVCQTITSWFSNNPQFVILDRTTESAINAELVRSSSSNSSVGERSKLQAEKSADVVITLEGGDISFTERSTQFKHAGSLHRATAKSRFVIKALDVSTKGEIGRTTLNLTSELKSARSKSQARLEAVEDLKNQLSQKLPPRGVQLLHTLDSARLKVDENGNITLLSPTDFSILRNVKQIQLWRQSKESTSTESAGVFNFDPNTFTVESSSSTFKQDEIFSFSIIQN